MKLENLMRLLINWLCVFGVTILLSVAVFVLLPLGILYAVLKDRDDYMRNMFAKGKTWIFPGLMEQEFDTSRETESARRSA